jgi:hypothetical protein
MKPMISIRALRSIAENHNCTLHPKYKDTLIKAIFNLDVFSSLDDATKYLARKDNLQEALSTYITYKDVLPLTVVNLATLHYHQSLINTLYTFLSSIYH